MNRYLSINQWKKVDILEEDGYISIRICIWFNKLEQGLPLNQVQCKTFSKLILKYFLYLIIIII